MALTKKPRSRWWSRLHFLARCAGLTGLFLGSIGVVLALVEDALSWEAVRSAAVDLAGGVPPGLALGLLLGGSLAAVLALLVEVIVGLRTLAGRRGAFGLNAALQAALAAALLVAVNVYSFEHYRRLDWTRTHE